MNKCINYIDYPVDLIRYTYLEWFVGIFPLPIAVFNLFE